VLVAQQREIIATAARIVVEGRDIGTVVAPEARPKVYLTASADARAHRRSTEADADLDATAVDLARRDRLDSTRTTDPLAKAADASPSSTPAAGNPTPATAPRSSPRRPRPPSPWPTWCCSWSTPGWARPTWTRPR